MRILHILSDGPTELSSRVMEAQAGENEIKEIDLRERKVSYVDIVDDIFSFDRVICW
jgi:hypothetical protein